MIRMSTLSLVVVLVVLVSVMQTLVSWNNFKILNRLEKKLDEIENMGRQSIFFFFVTFEQFNIQIIQYQGLMIMKYVRTPGQAETLLRDYEEVIIKVTRMLETEEDLRTRALLQECLAENMTAKRNLERFLNDNPDIFK